MTENIYFITGNANKFNEAKTMLPEIKQIDLDLPEIQELDPKRIIEEKLREAAKVQKGTLFCEDVSLYINSLNNFPGPLIKWFLKSLGTNGIWELIKDKDRSAIAKSIIGLIEKGNIIFFEGEVKGEIVEPLSKKGYGWDALFKPEGDSRTFAEFKEEPRVMRKQALIKLKRYLTEKK